MTYTLDIDLKTKEAKKLLEFLKSLNYLKMEEVKEVTEELKSNREDRKMLMELVKDLQSKTH
ncbi:MAG: hypothetical protein KF900_12175 [Bacteroidetes bacterium]|nr:hypothetical protein [Bacteroidota bacterium]